MSISDKRRHKIGQHEYELTLFGARQGQRVLMRLLKCLAPGGVQAVTGNPYGAIASLFDRISDADLDFFVDAFGERTKILVPTESKAGQGTIEIPLLAQYDVHFARRYGDAIAWLVWAALENYSDFLGDVQSGALGSQFQGLSALISPTK